MLCVKLNQRVKVVHVRNVGVKQDKKHCLRIVGVRTAVRSYCPQGVGY